MPAFTASRRRVIAALALTSALLITLDLQGNSAVGSLRRGFGTVFSPFEDAGRVVSRPIENTWRGIRDYPDVAAENRRLQQQLAEQEADQIRAEAEIADARAIKQADGLDPELGIDTVVARVLGGSPTNVDQTVTINKGSSSGIEVGLMVTVGQSLVGKITAVTGTDRSTVMLLTDPQFSVAVKVENPVEPAATTTTSPDQSVPDGSVADTTTTTAAPTETTTIAPTETTTTLVGGAVPNDPLAPITTAPPDATADPAAEPARQDGSLEGRGADHYPYVVRISDSPRFGRAKINAVVRTSGGLGESLAPEDLLVGTVTKSIPQAGSGGDTLEVKPAVDLTSLDFVAVLKYKPGS